MKPWTHYRAKVANLTLNGASPDDPELQQAYRALQLARTEFNIAKAIENAPPLDAETVAKLHALIPAPSESYDGPEAA